MDPINYTGQFAPVNPLQSVLQGLQVGQGIAGLRQQQQATERKAAFQGQLRSVLANPQAGAQDYLKLSADYPEFSEAASKTWSTLSDERKQSELANSYQVLAAIQGGQPQAAEQMLRDEAETLRSSGAAEAEIQKRLRTADLIKADPAKAMQVGALMLSAIDPKFSENWDKLRSTARADEAQPDVLAKGAADAAKAQAEAERAAVLAKYADQGQRMELAAKSEEIRASRENTRLRAIEAAYAREGNDLKREELKQKLDAARTEVATKAAERLAEADSAMAGLEDATALVDKLLDPNNRGDLLGATGTLAFLAAIPGTDARSTRGDIERLQSTLAAANLEKLKGPLSDKDVLFLKSIASNLDRYQDEDKFIAELERVRSTLTAGRRRLGLRYGNPPKAAPAASPVPGAPAADDDVSDLLEKYK